MSSMFIKKSLHHYKCYELSNVQIEGLRAFAQSLSNAGLGRVWGELICNSPPPAIFFDEEKHVSASHVDCLPTHIKGHVEVVSNDGRVAVDVDTGSTSSQQ